MLARRAAREQKNGDIAATDCQQKRDRSQEQVHRLLQIVCVGLSQSAHADFELFGKDIGRLLVELLIKRRELSSRGSETDSWLQLDFDAVSLDLIVAQLQRGIDVRASPGEAHRHDSDDLVRLVVKLDGFPHGFGIALEVALPEFVGQNHHLLRILTIGHVGRCDVTANQRRHSQEMKGRSRHLVDRH